jgi:hypothetical protein
MKYEQQLTTIFQIHAVPERVQIELKALFKKSNRESFRQGWEECDTNRSYD